MAVLDWISGDDSLAGKPQDPNWARNPRGSFHRFVNLDPEEAGLSGVSGVYVIWHSGVRPGWVHVGDSDDLAKTFHRLGENEDILDYEVNGGLFVSWTLIRGEFQEGVVCYLTEAMDPLVKNPATSCKDVKPIPVIPPGAKPNQE